MNKFLKMVGTIIILYLVIGTVIVFGALDHKYIRDVNGYNAQLIFVSILNWPILLMAPLH